MSGDKTLPCASPDGDMKKKIQDAIITVNATYVTTSVREVQLRRNLLSVREVLETFLENAPPRNVAPVAVNEKEIENPPCPSCNGKGQYWHVSSTDPMFDGYEDCPACNGLDLGTEPRTSGSHLRTESESPEVTEPKKILMVGLNYEKRYREAVEIMRFMVKSGATDFIFKIEASDRIQALEAEVKRLEDENAHCVKQIQKLEQQLKEKQP